jgi:hypothetical protein
MEHCNGTAWKQVSFPQLAGANGLSSSSAKDVWAVSGGSASFHYNGTAWTQVKVPAGTADSSLSGVVDIAAGNVWATGNDGGTTLIDHWNGTAWKRVSSPSPGN